jgi:fructan beta-fructosidase
VLDDPDREFRDPKVFWHAPERKWVMVVARSVQRKVAIYVSPDLKQWEHLSDFGPANAVGGAWECPDLSRSRSTATAAARSGSWW